MKSVDAYIELSRAVIPLSYRLGAPASTSSGLGLGATALGASLSTGAVSKASTPATGLLGQSSSAPATGLSLNPAGKYNSSNSLNKYNHEEPSSTNLNAHSMVYIEPTDDIQKVITIPQKPITHSFHNTTEEVSYPSIMKVALSISNHQTLSCHL